MVELVLIVHNIRSTHNVGSLLRTADGLGVNSVYLTGYTPYPLTDDDERLPHLARKIDAQIHKTALGAEHSQAWEYFDSVEAAIEDLHWHGYWVIALEQTPESLPLPEFKPGKMVAIIVGREVEGLEPEVLALCDQAVEIPMFGQKESFNVATAAAMALYHCRFAS